MKEKYEFWLEISERLTMSVYDPISQSQPILIFNKTDQKFYRRDPDQENFCDSVFPTNFSMDEIPTADGLHRHFVAVNQSMPGPTLVVFQNSEVLVHVKNNLAETASVHFHGLDQRGTFFMDGVAGISQCPILPDEEFTYKFNVSLVFKMFRGRKSYH